jgi:regulator of PEP synthase PpsR (kinase-PPPase family)
MSLPKKKVNVFIVSDATGITTEIVAGVALVQFRQVEPIFKDFLMSRQKNRLKTF